MKNIEAEVRSFISKGQYENLLDFFKKNSDVVKENDNQETFYFDCDHDLRIQRNNFFSKIKVKWFRKRSEFKWDNITVCLDFTKGHGYIIELEKMCSENSKKKEFDFLKQKLKSLGIDITPKDEFDKKSQFYMKNWRSLV